jgi:hypothetical protein
LETKKSQLEGLPEKTQGNEKGLGKKVQPMIEKELKIRDNCGYYALDIPNYNGNNFTLLFNSRRNAETVKHIIEVDDSKPNNATVCEMEEIKHGKWEYDSGDVGYTNYLCSECKNFLTFYEEIDLYPYCPYCGVKMDKE